MYKYDNYLLPKKHHTVPWICKVKSDKLAPYVKVWYSAQYFQYLLFFYLFIGWVLITLPKQFFVVFRTLVERIISR